jgi:hypothetical protein
VDNASFTRIEKAALKNLPLGWRDFLDTPITEVHTKALLSKEACNKAPRRDGTCLESFKVNWDSINNDMLAQFNQMYLCDRITEKQKNRFVLCIPKTDTPTTSRDYGPIDSVNTDYKIASRIIANRTRSAPSDILHRSQYCGVPGNTICDAVTAVRDAIAYAELTHACTVQAFPWTSQQLLTLFCILLYFLF